MALVGPFGRLPSRDRDRLPVELRTTVGPPHDGVLEEVLVVTAGVVVRARVRAPAFFARNPRLDHARGEIEQVAELERLRQVAVENLSLVLDDYARVALTQRVHDLPLLLHLLFAAEDAEVPVHRLGELVADRPRPLSLRAVEQAPQLDIGVANRGLRHRRLAAGLRRLGRMPSGALAEGDRLHQRIPTEAVRAVHRDAGDLAG